MGGAKLTQSFAKENVIDEIILIIVPQTWSSGIPLNISFSSFYLKQTRQLGGYATKSLFEKKDAFAMNEPESPNHVLRSNNCL